MFAKYSTDGTAIDAGFTAENANAQSIYLRATGFEVAQPTFDSTDVTLANQRIGGSESQALTLTNTDIAPAGFQEGLDASVFRSGGAVSSTSGIIRNLAQGDSNNTAFIVSVDTDTAGAKTGDIEYALASNGNGTSGLRHRAGRSSSGQCKEHK